MRLLAYAADGGARIAREWPNGALSAIAPLDRFFADLAGGLGAARAADPGDLRKADVKLVPPVPSGARVFCVGVNYRAHAAEGGHEVAAHPTIFSRWRSSLTSDGSDVPALDAKLDWEGELAVVIGRAGFRVPRDEALQHVLGYAPFNDISLRTYQRHSTQWALGKNGDGTGCLGAIVTSDEPLDVAAGLQLTTRLNGAVVQSASTAEMVYGIAEIIAYVSQVTRLEPGDVIATGTPEGVGHARRPPLFMKPGDEIEVEIEGVGRVRNAVVSM